VENVRLNDITVPVQDYQRDVNTFLLQHELLKQRGNDVVLGVVLESAGEKLFIPVDLYLRHRIAEAGSFEYRFLRDYSNLREIFDERLAYSIKHIKNMGLTLGTQSSEQGTQTFFRRLADNFITRWTSLADKSEDIYQGGMTSLLALKF
jgi:hypothetical protein